MKEEQEKCEIEPFSDLGSMISSKRELGFDQGGSHFF